MCTPHLTDVPEIFKVLPSYMITIHCNDVQIPEVITVLFHERWRLLFSNLLLFFSKCAICCDMTVNLWSSVKSFQACLGVKTLIIYHQQWKALWSGATWTDINAIISLNVQPNMVLNWFVSGAVHPTRIMFGIIYHYCLHNIVYFITICAGWGKQGIVLPPIISCYLI